MLARLTSENRLILPEGILAHFPEVEYFRVERTGDGILLRPVRVPPLARIARIQEKMAASGITESDVRDAVAWARRRTE